MKRLLLLTAIASSALAQTVVLAPYEVTTPTGETAPVVQTGTATTLIKPSEFNLAASMADLLRLVPGASVAQSGAPGSTTSLFTRGTASYQTLLMVDGRRQSPNLAGSADWNALSLTGVSSVEFVRTASSQLYGGDALGGVVNVNTLATVENSVAAYAGDLGQYGGSLLNSVTNNRLSLSYDDAVWSRPNSVEKFLSGRDRFFGTPWRNLYAEMEVSGYNMSTGSPGSTASPDLGARTIQNRFDVSPGVEATMDDTTLSLYGTYDWYFLGYRDPAAYGGPSNDKVYVGDESIQLTGKTKGSFWHMIYGSDIRESKINRDNIKDVSNIDAEQKEKSAFLDGGLTASDVDIELGARYDNNSQYGNFLSSRVALTGNLGSWHPYVSESRAFSLPTYQDLYYPIYSNPTLLPEHGLETEVGSYLNLGSWLVQADVYRLDSKDTIVFVGSAPQNVATTRSQGTELSVTENVGNFLFRLSYSYNDVRDNHHVRLVRHPYNSGGASLVYDLKYWSIGSSASGSANFRDSDPATFRNVEAPDWVQVK